MAKALSPGRKALVIKRVGKINKIVGMLGRVKGLDLSAIKSASAGIVEQLDELGTKPAGKKGKSAPAADDGADLL
jgi:hypothetical protein